MSILLSVVIGLLKLQFMITITFPYYLIYYKYWKKVIYPLHLTTKKTVPIMDRVEPIFVINIMFRHELIILNFGK